MPFLIIARQPDLGTAVTLLPILLVVAYVAGMPMKYIYVMAGASPCSRRRVAYKFGLQDYQRERISTFLDPAQDPKGAGYQQIQARITVGSGGVWGKGFMQGTQGQLRFLPVAHNDFIFSVLAEEQGLVGVLAVLGLYLFVIMRALDAARLAKDRLGAYLVLGVLSAFTFQVIYNITMSAGLAPVKGLTLPLMSYGGSSMIATLASFGLILNVQDAPVYELMPIMAGPGTGIGARHSPAAPGSRLTALLQRSLHEQGNDHLLERPRNPRRHSRGRPAR